MELHRVGVDEAALAAFDDELEAMIDAVAITIIYNVDETSCLDWADAHEIRVLVPDTYTGSSIAIPFDWHSKRATLLGCIAADSSTIRSMIVVERVIMESDIPLAGYSSEKVNIYSQSDGYMTRQFFERWVDQIFLLHVEQARRALADSQAPTILVLEGFNAHHIDALVSETIDRNISPIFLVPHSSDQCQLLNLVTYGNMKRLMSTPQIRYLPSNQSQKIGKMLGAWHQDTDPHLLVSALTAMGLIPFIGGDGFFYMCLDRQRRFEFGHGLAKVPIQWILGKEATEESDSGLGKEPISLISS
jgi:hypothetical protein